MANFDTNFMAMARAKIDVVSPTNSKITLEPLESGFGDTLGNALRRILLSSMPGSAVSEVKINGVQHEYAPIEGCQEDAIDILLNLKELSVRLNDEIDHATLTLSVKGNAKGLRVVTAKDIVVHAGVEIVKTDHIICNLNKEAKIDMEILVETGYGFRTIDHGAPESKEEVGVLQLDTTFSPVVRVAYNVENARVGNRTDLDKLIIHLETNGTLDPEQAIRSASALLQQQLMAISGMKESHLMPQETLVAKSVNPLMNHSIDELDLSVRAANCLKQEQIFLIGDLVQRSKQNLLKTPNLGEVSLKEISQKLEERGLSFGMTVENWNDLGADKTFGQY